MSEYAVELRGGRVVLPPLGSGADLVSVSSWNEAEANLAAFAAPFYGRRRSHKAIRTRAMLVHRADNTYNSFAISVSTPAANGGSLDQRHLGYLNDHFLRRVGWTNLPDLIRFGGGEVECTVVLEGPGDISVDLPDPVTLGEAIRTFLAGDGIQAAGAPRPDDAPRELHTHTVASQTTAKTLRLLGTYAECASAVTGLRFGTGSYVGVEGRTLFLTDSGSGRPVGFLEGRWLLLDDERNRDEVLGLLDREGIPVNRPVANPKLEEDGTWPQDVPPNVRFRQRTGGLDLRVHDPEAPNSQETFAIYNPTLDVLWVEDSRLVAPALRFMHRQGIDVAEVGLPRRSWGLETEVSYRVLRDPGETRDFDLPAGDQVLLLDSVRPLIPDGILTDTVIWISGDGSRRDPEPYFDTRERHVRQRSTLFPVHTLTGKNGQCRLCGGHAAVFTTPIATERLAYCHTCLASAVVGLVEDRARPGAALKELSAAEFDGQPMLASQLESLHINPHEPVDATTIDRLLLLRFGIARERFAWTVLLEAAGFAESGLRTGRGTLIRSRDGHLCLSLRERAVCDFFHQHHIEHEREPKYPHDPDYNPHGLRRADWLLTDGTLVEMWGLPNDPDYAAKMVEKRLLADRHGLNLVELLERDLPRLLDIFDSWLPAGTNSPWSWSPLAVLSATAAEKLQKKRTLGDDRGRNDFNTNVQRERVTRSAEAVRLQQQGLTRAEIGKQLGVGADTVKMLRHDGKFYADPTSDPARAALARQAQAARDLRLTRAQFQAREDLTAPRAQQAWRDAAVLHEKECRSTSRPSSSLRPHAMDGQVPNDPQAT